MHNKIDLNLKAENNNSSLLSDGKVALDKTDKRSAEINNQLFRYAEDFQQMIVRNENLMIDYETLLQFSSQQTKSLETLNVSPK